MIFGNSENHRLWNALLATSSIQATGTTIGVGDRTWHGSDLVALLIRARPDSERATVAAIATTGAASTRLAATLPIFVSGVAYPDWTVVDASMLEVGAQRIRATGFFGPGWALDPERSA